MTRGRAIRALAGLLLLDDLLGEVGDNFPDDLLNDIAAQGSESIECLWINPGRATSSFEPLEDSGSRRTGRRKRNRNSDWDLSG